jgi:hypothetical protein
MSLQKLKLYWSAYQNTDLKYFKSLNNTWENILDNSPSDNVIYFDSTNVPDNCSLFLVEPKSIHSKHYHYALNNSNRLKYILSYDRDFFSNTKNFIHIPPPFGAWVNGEERQVYNKTKNISFIASNKNMCEEHAFRHEMVNKFGKFCDVFGRGRKEISKKIEGLADYRFSFCMENHVTNLYYTEKLLDCFLSGTIPIFYGSRSISNVFDSNGIIWLNDILNGNVNINNLNESLYNSKIESVIKNFNIANEMNNGVSNSLDKAITNGLK